MIAGIELGGTKTVVAIGQDDGTIVEQHRFPTTNPEETLATAADWLQQREAIEALGIGSFGPIGINSTLPSYGRMLPTPKESWSQYDLLGNLGKQLPGVSMALETDVNTALLAEVILGAAQGFTNVAYVTIGTGIGGSFVADGRLLHGALHSELGHLKVPRHPEDTFPGVCQYHQDCLEGLASGPAIAARWGTPGHELPPDHPAWEMEAWYLAHGALAMCAITGPSRLIIGGGVSQATGFHDKVETTLRRIAHGYFPALEAQHPFVVAPDLEQDAGIRGALLLGSHRAGRNETLLPLLG